jgi:hypothetical protein
VEQVLQVSQTKGALVFSRITKMKLKPETFDKGFVLALRAIFSAIRVMKIT